MTTETQPELRTIDELEADSEWQLHQDVVRNIDQRLDVIRELCETMEWYLDRDDEIQVEDMLALHDKVNALIATSIMEDMVVDETGAPISYEDWLDYTEPAVSEDEVVLNASEFERQLDNVYDAGVDDTWDKAWAAVDAEADYNINTGILIAARVLKVLGARLVDVDQLRD